MRLRFALLSALICVACGAPDEVTPETDLHEELVSYDNTSLALSSRDFEADFTDCTEYVGIGFVPKVNARPLVPAQYALVGDEQNALLVVRVVDCGGISVDGKKAKTAKLSQLGIMLAGGDPSADINNYTLWFATNLGALHGKLTAAGVAGDVDQLSFTFTPNGAGGGAININVSPPQAPDFQASGSGIIPTSSPVPFIASWWAEGQHGTVQMRTVFPAIRFSGASVTLTTSASSDLADLIGGTSLTFPILDSYNAFNAAHMDVTVQ
jgi:hypothetical protein